METPLLAESWLLDLEGRGASAGTLRAYRAALRALAAHLGSVDYTDAVKDDLRRWLAEMRRGKFAQNTIRQRVKIVKAFFVWLDKESELHGPSPAVALTAPAETRPDVRVLSDAEVVALMATCTGQSFKDRRDSAILLVLLDAGLRRAECARLRTEDVDVRAGTIHVVGKGSRMRGPRHRVVAVGMRSRRALDAYLRARRRIRGSAEMDALWLSDHHKGVTTSAGIRHVVEERGRQAGIPDLHAHALRHSWASKSRRAGLSEGDLMVLGGWSNRRELDRYGRTDAADRARDAYRRVSVADRLHK